MKYSSMSSRAKDRYLDAHPECMIRATASVVVDYSHATGLVRGALCRRCNGTMGSLEAALRLPDGPFQSVAADLHDALRRNGTAPRAQFYTAEECMTPRADA